MHKRLCGPGAFSLYAFSKRCPDQGRAYLGLGTHAIPVCHVSVSEPLPVSACVFISKFACASVQDLCSLCSLQIERQRERDCACVCVGGGHVDMCIPVCLSSPGCCCLPGLDAFLFSVSVSHTHHVHMCHAGGEGAGVSASSCVTRLISPQPGRLGPEGSGGGGAGPHSPSDKYVFGAAVLKGHGGRRRRRGGLYRRAAGFQPGPARVV